MDMDFSVILVLTAVLLLPGLCAYALYSRLPSKTVVTGPFKGLDVQLTGAFAGYFLLVLVSAGFVFTWLGRKSTLILHSAEYETWLVRGKIQLASGGPAARAQEAVITFKPRLFEVNDDGTFYTVLPVPKGITSSVTTMQIERPPYGAATILLTADTLPATLGVAYGVQFDSARHTIQITDVVELPAPPAEYDPQTSYKPQLVP
jgi:hypothetical protein